jgi:GntR family transcriptional regulator/MocR family aminotransferase
MDLHLELGRGAKRTQIEHVLRTAVRTGRLRPATRLPASRTLAGDLGVSRGVVVEAYEQLVAEGWLVARRGDGTRVAALPARHAQAGDSRRSCFGVQDEVPFDLRTGRADLSAFPRAAWHQALGRALRTLPDSALDYGDWRGHEPLRDALAAHLGRTRGVVGDPADVVVCGGLYQGLTVVWRALRRRGARRVAIEDPGWRGQRRSVELAGLECVTVAVDADGIVVEDLAALDVDAVVVTPAHQHPTGVVLAPERRAQLVAWARERAALVVEDDYDAEYRYDRDPVGALQGLAPDHVLYAGSASKTLAPALRLAWLVAPAHLTGDLAREKDLADRGTPVLDQAALADLLGRGDVDRHLRRTRRRYRARRDALVEALGPDAGVSGIAAGLHAVVPLGAQDDGSAVAAACLARGVRVETIHGSCTVVAPRAGGLLLGYAALPEPSLRRAAALVRAALAETGS